MCVVVLVGLGHDDDEPAVDVPAQGRRVRDGVGRASPARPARASRRNSARYLLSTAETACSLVMARAATVAARSSRWTSSAVSGRSPTNAAEQPVVEAARRRSAPWRAGVRRRAASRMPTGSRSVIEAAGAVEAVEGQGCGEVVLAAGLASTRPSLVVTIAAPPRKPASRWHEVLEAAAGEHDADEDLVRLLDALEDAGLLVEHRAEDLGDDALGRDRGRRRAPGADRLRRARARQRPDWSAVPPATASAAAPSSEHCSNGVLPAASHASTASASAQTRWWRGSVAAPSSEARVTPRGSWSGAVDQLGARERGQGEQPLEAHAADEVTAGAPGMLTLAPDCGASGPMATPRQPGRHPWQHSP